MTDIDISQNLGILAERIQSTRDDIGEIKIAGARMEARGITFEKTYIAEHAKLASVVDAAHTRIDNQAIRLAEIKIEIYELTKTTRAQLLLLTEAISPLIMTSRVLMYVGGILGTAVTALIIAIITGQVQFVFK